MLSKIIILVLFVMVSIPLAAQNELIAVGSPGATGSDSSASVSSQARIKIMLEKIDARVAEAKRLILEAEKLERRLKEIGERLDALDEGAKAKSSNGCTNCITSGTGSLSITR